MHQAMIVKDNKGLEELNLALEDEWYVTTVTPGNDGSFFVVLTDVDPDDMGLFDDDFEDDDGDDVGRFVESMEE